MGAIRDFYQETCRVCVILALPVLRYPGLSRTETGACLSGTRAESPSFGQVRSESMKPR
jgi:hypothetical protein